MIILLLVYFVYVLIWVSLVVGVGVFVWRRSKSKAATSVSVLLAFLSMYWPVFNDFYPTLHAHKQYCDKEAGLKIYLTPEQWAMDNPDVLELLTPYEKFIVESNLEMGNERIGMKYVKSSITDFPVQKKVESLIDIKTEKVLYEYVDFSRGYGHLSSGSSGSIKFWLYSSSCYSDDQLQENLVKRMEFLKKLNTKWSR